MGNNTNKKKSSTEARERIAEIRKQEKAREKRNKALMGLGIGVAVLLIAGLVAFIFIAGNDPERTPFGALSENEIPANTADGAIPVSSAGAGQTDPATTELDVYMDYTCPYCYQFEDLNGDTLAELVSTGDITVRYYPVALLDANQTTLAGFSGEAANASFTVADGSPEHFQEFMHAAFVAYHDNSGATPGDPAEVMREVALDVGVDENTADRILEGEFKSYVNAATRHFANQGFSGTPTILLNGEDVEGTWLQPGEFREMLLDGEVAETDVNTEDPENTPDPDEQDGLPSELEE